MNDLDLDAKIASGFRARLEAQRKEFKRSAQREYRYRFIVLGYSLRKIEGHWDWYIPPRSWDDYELFEFSQTEWWRAHRITPRDKLLLRTLRRKEKHLDGGAWGGGGQP